MKTTQLAIFASALLGGLVEAVPMGGTLRNRNEEICARAGACGHHMDCTQLWMSCNLKLLLEGKGGLSEDGVSKGKFGPCPAFCHLFGYRVEVLCSNRLLLGTPQLGIRRALVVSRNGNDHVKV